MITLANAESALKDYYLEAVTKEIDEKGSPFYSAIEKSTAEVYGKDVKISMVKGCTNSVVAGDESADLPSPYSNRYLSVTLPLKNIYGTIEISDKAIRASRDDSGAFVNLLNAEMQGLVNSAKNSFSRMLFGDGNGYMFSITSRQDSYVYNASGLKKSYEGLTVDIYDSSTGGEYGTGVVIESVDVDAGTVTLDTDVVKTDAISAAVCAAGVYGKELLGLRAIFNCDSLYGYAKSDESYLSPAVYSLTGALTEDALVTAIDAMEEEYDNKPDMIIVSFATRKAIGELIAENRRVVNTTDMAIGFGEITVAGIPVYADRYCPDNTVYILNSSDFKLCQLCDWEWMEDEDGKILKQIAGKAAYSATLVKYAELVCTRPCAQSMITFE